MWPKFKKKPPWPKSGRLSIWTYIISIRSLPTSYSIHRIQFALPNPISHFWGTKIRIFTIVGSVFDIDKLGLTILFRTYVLFKFFFIRFLQVKTPSESKHKKYYQQFYSSFDEFRSVHHLGKFSSQWAAKAWIIANCLDYTIEIAKLLIWYHI